MPRQLTRRDVRQLAITKQHLNGTPSPDMLTVVQNMGCVQLDPISAVERSHLLVLWSRLGAFDESALDVLLWDDRKLFEYWAHAASIVLTDDYPVHNWYMRHVAQSAKTREWYAERDLLPLIDHVREYLHEHGPSLSRDMDDGGKDKRYQHQWWSGRYLPRVLQHLWTRGEVMIVGRSGKQRIWGLTEDFLPEWASRDVWTDEQVTRYAAQRAVQGLGVATPTQMKYHYTRDRYPTLPETLDSLVEEQVLERVDVVEDGESLKGDWYIHTDDIPLLEKIQSGEFTPRTALLSPFDNLICDRDRTEALFDFYFRIEIYVPKDKREYGYYVMPILHGDRLIGRIDPKMDRKTGTLHINAVYAEDTAPDDADTVAAIRGEIQSLADFLGAKKIKWGRKIPKQWKGIR